MKRILVVVPFPMSEAERDGRRAQLDAIETDPEMAFTFRSVKAAPRNYVSAVDLALADLGIFEAAASAQEEGFDAVCIDTMSDSGVDALRSVLSIPVVGPGRSSMLFALMLGKRFSIITMWDRWRHLYDKTLNDLGLHHACASIRSVDIAPDNLGLLSGKEEHVFPHLEREARSAIDIERADVILLGSTTMHQAHAYLQAKLDVPVINPGPLTYSLVAAMLGLRISQSRRAYPASPVSRMDMIAAMMSAAGKFEH